MGGRQKQAPTPGPASSSIPVPEDAVRQLIEAQRAEAELSVIAAQLRGIPELKREPDAPISDYVDGLLKRRAELLKGRKATAMLKREVRPRPLDSLVLSVAAHFGPWTTVWMPYFGPGWERTPRTAGTSGRISREDFDPKESFGFPGSIRYSFLATDSGEVDPHKPKYWVTASAASINLPEAPFDGELYFRFRVCGLTDFWRVDDYSGYYSQFVWIGGTPDIVTDNPFLVTAEVVGLNPLQVDLGPLSGTSNQSVSGLPSVWGSLPVMKGKTPALAFQYGVSLGVASGTVQGSGAFYTVLEGASPEPAPQDQGKIEYKFEPDWWIKAIQDRVKAAL